MNDRFPGRMLRATGEKKVDYEARVKTFEHESGASLEILAAPQTAGSLGMGTGVPRDAPHDD